MNWHSVPVAIMAGISAYAAILFIGFYSVLSTPARRRERREYFTFALMCLAVTAYDVTCVGLYNAVSVAEGVRWQRGNFATAALIGVTYMFFTSDFMGGKMARVARVYALLLMPVVPLVLVLDSPWGLTAARPLVKHVVVGRLLDVTYFEGDAGPICTFVFVTVFVGYMFAVVSLARYFRAEKRRGVIGFFAAAVVSFVTAMNDSLVSAGVYKFVYTFEYGIAMILMAMGNALFLRFGELHEEVEALNEGLARSNAGLVVALEQARESARAKTEFLATISHELRTPLNAIINLPEGMVDEFVTRGRARCNACHAEFELEVGEAVDASTACPECGCRGALAVEATWHFEGEAASSRRHLQTVGRAGRHLLGLVSSILDASKLELGRVTLTMEAVMVGDLVTDVVESVRPMADKGNVALQTFGVAAAPQIRGDRVKLGQVLYNLLGNAIKFSPAQSTIDVTVTLEKGAEGAEHVVLSVRDRGIGIAPADREIIFEKFRQLQAGATRAYGGTGLGLAISRSLVELHGGTIWVESAPGGGSNFRVRLPVRGVAPPRREAHDEHVREREETAPRDAVATR
jgi:signal transduction histidine kinase